MGAIPYDAPFPRLVPPNVLGLFHLLDAMRTEGVRRVVLASSIQVLRSVEEQYTGAPHHRGPGNHYALTKVFAEEMGAMYAEHFGLEVIAARIGFMVRDQKEAGILVERRMADRYVSRGDMARFCERAVCSTFSGFAVLYAVGPDGRERFDLEAARRAIGYQPEDAWPAGLPFDLPS
jgi:uronate dehydrogenase